VPGACDGNAEEVDEVVDEEVDEEVHKKAARPSRCPLHERWRHEPSLLASSFGTPRRSLSQDLRC